MLETEISELRAKMRTHEEDKAKLGEELSGAKLKNGKLLVKVKQLTKEVESLKKSKGGAGDDLDRALQDEMKLQADKTQSELVELKKEMDNARMEKEHMTKKIETLLSANEKMVEMKEKQDNEVEFLQYKNKELTNKLDALNWQLSEVLTNKKLAIHTDYIDQSEIRVLG